MNSVRWVAIAFVLGLCAAYALWGSGGGAPPAPTTPAAPPTPVKTAVSPNPPAGIKKTEKTDGAAPTPNEPGSSAATLLKFDPPSVDFGEVSVGSSKIRKVSVRNISDKTLQINWAKGSCGCMKAQIDSQDLAPGAAADLTLTFTGLAGHRPESYHAEVHLKDIDSPASVDVRAKVLQIFSAEPDKLQFDRIAKGESKTLSTVIRRLDGQPFNIINASIANKHDEVMIQNPVEVPGSNKSAYTMSVTVTGLRRARLMLQAIAVSDVTIKQETATIPGTIPVNIFADVDGDDVVVEKTVNSALDGKGKLLPFTATLKRMKPGPLSVEKVEDSGGGTVTFTPEKIDELTLKLNITMESNIKQRQPFGEFRIFTNNDKEPIRLPYNLPRQPGSGFGN